MRPPRPSAPLVAVEGTPGSRLENMSSRPTTAVTHAPRRKPRQLVPSLRVRLDLRRVGAARRRGRPLHAVDLPADLERATATEQARTVERICRAVIDDLRLPGVIALSPGGTLPREETCTDPLLALTILTRCSGPVWLRDRPSALERLTVGRPVGLLLQPALIAHVNERLAVAGWSGAILARAEVQEDSR